MTRRAITPGLTDADVLGGAALKYPRRRGFKPWRPRAKNQAFLGQIQAVLDEYRDYWPPPDLLNRILRSAIVARTDRRVLKRVLEREREERREVLARIGETEEE